MTDLRYKDKIEVNTDGTLITPTVVLTTRSGKQIGVIRNIQSFRANHPMGDTAEISFDVYKYVDGIRETCWDSIKDFKMVLLPTVTDTRYKWYEITVNIDETTDTIKHVTGIHANEAELGQLMLYEVEINTEGDIDRPEYETIMIDGKEYGTVFYCPEHPKNSLLHRILSDKASHYAILHVDDTLKNIQREFSFNGTSIVDAMRQDIAQEIQCLFVFGENRSIGDTNEYQRTISVYDLLDYCEDCGQRGNYTGGVCPHCGSKKIKYGYGKDTGIFVNTDNLTDSISFTSATDQVKNFFRLAGGDDDMTAAIRNCNPSGSAYLTFFSDEMKEDMSEALVNRLNEYNTIYDSYLKDEPITLPSEDIEAYNQLVDKYQGASKEEFVKLSTPVLGFTALTDYDYNSVNFRDFLQTTMMPKSEVVDYYSAEDELAKLTVQTMSPIGVENASDMSLTSANTAVKEYAKVYVDTSMYKIDVSNSTYIDNTWEGNITVTSLTEYDDTASKVLTLEFNNEDEEYIKQKIQKAMAQYKAQDIGDVSFLQKPLAEIQPELKKYSLDSLNLLDEVCTAVMDILAQDGHGAKKDDFYDYYGIDLYDEYYYPYWQKKSAIMAEEKVREEEVSTIQKVIDDINEARKNIFNLLNMENFFGDLYPELMLYRREDEYSNSNFISDGLTDSEIIRNAHEFFKRAREEIVKAATIQHTISGNLYNLFLMPEFRKFISDDSELVLNGVDNTAAIKFLRLFDSGNWLRIRVDDKIYKLRMTNWEIEYDSPEQLSVEFSDVIYGNGIASDIASILSQARTMGNSYNAVARQAKKGSEAEDELGRTRRYGLVLNQNKILSDINEQSFVINSKGALMRAKNDFDSGYSDEQVKILNKGIYYTNDNWETVLTGLGHFIYYDPEEQAPKEDYGVIAKTVVGQLILGNQLKIYSESDTFEMGDDGFKITAHSDRDNEDLFVLRKEIGEGVYQNFIHVDRDGNTIINGSSVIIGTDPLDEYLDDEFTAIEDGIGELEEEVDRVDLEAQNAARYANDYISVDNSGLMVADLTDTYPEYYKPQTIPFGKNVLITNQNIQIREGHDHVLAQYGSDDIYLGERTDKNIHIHSTGEAGVDIKDANNIIAHFGEYIALGDKDGVLIDTDGVDILRYDDTSEQTKSAAFFGESVRIGEETSGHTNIGSGGMTVFGGTNGLTELANIGYGSGNGYEHADSEGSEIISPDGTAYYTAPYYTFGVRTNGGIIGNYSVVEGYGNTASGYGSHAEGKDNYAKAAYTHVSGIGNTANFAGQAVFGKYAIPTTSSDLFVVGKGYSNSNRQNAMRLMFNGHVEFNDAIGTGLKFNTRTIMRNKFSSSEYSLNTPYSFYGGSDWADSAVGSSLSGSYAFGIISKASSETWQLLFMTGQKVFKSTFTYSSSSFKTEQLYSLEDINTYFTNKNNKTAAQTMLANVLEDYAKTDDIPSITGYVTTEYAEQTYAKQGSLGNYVSIGTLADKVNGHITNGDIPVYKKSETLSADQVEAKIRSTYNPFKNAVEAILRDHSLIT